MFLGLHGRNSPGSSRFHMVVWSTGCSHSDMSHCSLPQNGLPSSLGCHHRSLTSPGLGSGIGAGEYGISSSSCAILIRDTELCRERLVGFSQRSPRISLGLIVWLGSLGLVVLLEHLPMLALLEYG